ncbi:MAG: alanine racemase [Bacillota bacterium]
MRVDAVSVMEVNLDHIVSNYQVVSRHVSPALVIPVLKGNGYGHGAVAPARVLVGTGCRKLAVARLSEARQLRKAGIGPQDADIIIMGPLLPDELQEAVNLEASVFAGAFWTLACLRRLALGRARPVRFHIKVDTGMGRMGFYPAQVGRVTSLLKSMTNYRLEGVATHLRAPSQQLPCEEQLTRFEEFLAGMSLPRGCLVHMASSSAVVCFPKLNRDAVRVGDLTYGFTSEDHPPFELRPALAYRTRVSQVKVLPAGWHLGYGTSRVTTAPLNTALIGLGTGDGMTGSQAGRGQVLIHGTRCRVLAVCADTSIVDVSHLSGVRVGDEVVYIGTQGREALTARDQAGFAGVGFAELLGKISFRIPRVYYQNRCCVGFMDQDSSGGIASLLS